MIKTYIKVDTKGLDRIDNSIERRTDSAVKDLANFVIDYVNSNWYGVAPPYKYPPTSMKGGAPFVRTGTLKKSVRTVYRDTSGRFAKGANVRAVTISYTAPYARFLEDEDVLDRPFLRPALDRAEPLVGYYLTINKVGRSN